MAKSYPAKPMSSSEVDRLSTYREKRFTDKTPEPFGGGAIPGRNVFVVHHHAARQLHYDLRLEMNGVLESWAVPKGPSPNPADKRLAVHVEAHPLEYADFEGIIPEGNYGAGAVIVWDRGIWIPIENPVEGMHKGKLLFELRGHKLHGRWTLVRTKENWLFIKERDAYVEEVSTDSYPEDSILSGIGALQLKAGFDPAPGAEKKLKKFKATNKILPVGAVKVMLAKPGKPFSDPDWVYEIKYDGYRLLAAREDGEGVLISRNGHNLTETFPEIADAVKHLPFEHVILDGEVIVNDKMGRPSFALLQKRGHLTRRTSILRAAAELPALFQAFDLLALNDYDLRHLPLLKRKELLEQVLPTTGPIRYTEHIPEHGEAMFEEVNRMRLEGVVAKKADSLYYGRRSEHWRKIPAIRTDDFVVIGYTDPKGNIPGFGALHVAQYDADENLVYLGRTGTGFSDALRKEITLELENLGTDAPPCEVPAETTDHWVQPQLVAEVRYKEITAAGQLRQAAFLRLRDDKPPEDCMLQNADQGPDLDSGDEAPEKQVIFSNLDKVFWRSDNFTKGDLIDYYRDISEWILPYLKDRPLVMRRYPDGIDGKSFYQKDAPGFAPPWLRVEKIYSEGSEREIAYFLVDDAEGLLYIANLASIALHMWHSRIGALELPDYCILDLDPKAAPFEHVIEIAKAIHNLCDEIGLQNYVKTSGSTGLHVLIPLGGQFTYEQCRGFGELLARVVCSQLPDIATVVRIPARREGKVYVDFMQNRRGQLLAAPYSARAKPGATVSMPLKWNEVRKGLTLQRYTIKNAAARMNKLGHDPVLPVLTESPDLVNAIEALGEYLANGKGA